MEGGQEKKKKKLLITFDIDGTLIRSSGTNSNQLHRQAFSHAFLYCFGIHGTIDAIQHHGQTDPGILLNTLVHYGIPYEVAVEQLSDLKAKMVEYARANVASIGEGLEVLAGVVSILQALSSRENLVIGLGCYLSWILVISQGSLSFNIWNILLCCPCMIQWSQKTQVTGNLEDIAWMKMEGLGIKKYFSVPNIGGFGSDHMDRGQLVKIAAERAEKAVPGGFDLRAHVGDAPSDIKAAEFGGALPIGVCTGVFGKDELEQASAGSAIVLPDLCDTEGFLKLLAI